jgi:hypothetical protein
MILPEKGPETKDVIREEPPITCDISSLHLECMISLQRPPLCSIPSPAPRNCSIAS